MATYTVKELAPTGKIDAKYGTEYIVHFNEDPREVKLSRKNQVSIGDSFHGEIRSNSYGAYFKTDQAPAPTQGGSYTGGSAKNSDGQRQGMCINNAAAYVNTFSKPNMPYDEWAKEVMGYASALYALGDLSLGTVVNREVIDDPKDAQLVADVDKLFT